MAVRLSVRGVSFGYTSDRLVLREITVAAQAGRMLAVTGSSGAGKTTLLRAMAASLRPTSGVVEVDGEPLRDRAGAVARKVVWVPQHNGLAPILTAGENVHIVLIANGCTPDEARRRTAEALESVGLSAQASQLIEELSGGQQQRAAVARGLALRGDVLLADEVTSELDAANRLRVLELLRAEARRGAAVVLATHDPEAAAACDDELHLIDGTAAASTTADLTPATGTPADRTPAVGTTADRTPATDRTATDRAATDGVEAGEGS